MKIKSILIEPTKESSQAELDRFRETVLQLAWIKKFKITESEREESNENPHPQTGQDGPRRLDNR